MCGVIGGSFSRIPCFAVSGCLGSVTNPTTYEDITFTTTDPREPFCVYEGQAGFWIMNFDNSNSVDLRMTCIRINLTRHIPNSL